MLQIKFQASEPSGSVEEDFEHFFLCISKIQTEDPWPGAIFNHRTFI